MGKEVRLTRIEWLPHNPKLIRTIPETGYILTYSQPESAFSPTSPIFPQNVIVL
jgi:hypothetical protein